MGWMFVEKVPSCRHLHLVEFKYKLQVTPRPLQIPLIIPRVHSGPVQRLELAEPCAHWRSHEKEWLRSFY